MGGISCCRFTVEGFKLPQTTDFRVSDILGSGISAAAIPNPHQIQHTVVSYINDQILPLVCHRLSRFRVLDILDILDIKISILARQEVILTRSTVVLTRLSVIFKKSINDLTRPVVVLPHSTVILVHVQY